MCVATNVSESFCMAYLENAEKFLHHFDPLKIENNSTWEGAFYQGEWAKDNSSWVILVFSRYVCCC